MPNTYSRSWFELFLETRPCTAQELEFIVRNLPGHSSQRILELCSGQGRLSNPLARLGHEVWGVDRDRVALEIAQSSAPPSARHLQMDMRHIREAPGAFDVVLCWWQSFGYFDEATNADVLRQICSKLRGGGRLLSDIYQRRYWEQNQGQHLTCASAAVQPKCSLISTSRL